MAQPDITPGQGGQAPQEDDFTLTVQGEFDTGDASTLAEDALTAPKEMIAFLDRRRVGRLLSDTPSREPDAKQVGYVLPEDWDSTAVVMVFESGDIIEAVPLNDNPLTIVGFNRLYSPSETVTFNTGWTSGKVAADYMLVNAQRDGVQVTLTNRNPKQRMQASLAFAQAFTHALERREEEGKGIQDGASVMATALSLYEKGIKRAAESLETDKAQNLPVTETSRRGPVQTIGLTALGTAVIGADAAIAVLRFAGRRAAQVFPFRQ